MLLTDDNKGEQMGGGGGVGVYFLTRRFDYHIE